MSDVVLMADSKAVLLPTESVALAVGLAQVLRGEAPTPNIAATCVLALARLAGKHDWTKDDGDPL